MAESSCKPANLVPRVFLPSLLHKLEQTSNLRAIRLVYEFDWLFRQFKRTKAKQNTNTALNSEHAQIERRSNVFAFSFPDSTLPQVSTKSRDSWSWPEGTWSLEDNGRDVWICMRSNNEQKQVVQTSLNRGYMWNIFSRVLLPESSAFCPKNVKHLWNWGAATLGERGGR